MDNIRIQAGLTLNQMKIVEGGIRSELGRKSIPSHYREHVSNQIHIFDDVFHAEKHNFITETDKGAATKYEDLWTFWAPIVPLIEAQTL